jgi:DNA-directed RNA polymerase beta' subunit
MDGNQDFFLIKLNILEMYEVKIYKGVSYEGTINKQQLSGGHYSIVHLLNKEYNVNMALQFINNVHFCSSEFLLDYGFSIGIKDCLDYNQEDINKIVYKCFLEADNIEQNIKNEYIRECKINGILGKAKDIGMKIVKNNIDTNNFVSTITSGSKGSLFNISQITSLLGQQNVAGERIQPKLYGNRTLVHYPFEIEDETTKYESKGFIRHSFIRGLDPTEFFLHSITGKFCLKVVSKILLVISFQIWQHIL